MPCRGAFHSAVQGHLTHLLPQEWHVTQRWALARANQSWCCETRSWFVKLLNVRVSHWSPFATMPGTLLEVKSNREQAGEKAQDDPSTILECLHLLSDVGAPSLICAQLAWLHSATRHQRPPVRPTKTTQISMPWRQFSLAFLASFTAQHLPL